MESSNPSSTTISDGSKESETRSILRSPLNVKPLGLKKKDSLVPRPSRRRKKIVMESSKASASDKPAPK